MKTMRFWGVVVLMVAIVLTGLYAPPSVSAGQVRKVKEFEFTVGEEEIEFDLVPGYTVLRAGSSAMADRYSLMVTNGEARGKDRVSSAKVILNGRMIFKQNRFNQNMVSLSEPLEGSDIRAQGNQLYVQVNGRPGSKLTVTLYGEFSYVTWYLDRDRDGYGDDKTSRPFPPGYNPGPYYSQVGGDCNDYDSEVYPGNGCEVASN